MTTAISSKAPQVPPIDHRRIGELAQEFTVFWNRLQALYLDSVVGFHHITDHLQAEQARARSLVSGSELDSEGFQDTRLFSYDGILPEEFCTSGIHRATQGAVKKRNSPNGANYVAIGQLCVIAFYDYWDDYLRPEYVKAKGLYDPDQHDESLRKYASHDLWGDLRQLRSSIVHHQGIATDDVKKCRIIKCFKPGDEIAITPEIMRAILLALLQFRNELHKEQFQKTFLLNG